MISAKFLSAIPHLNIMGTSEGRLKSPSIDIDHENPSIAGDFNRPSDVKTNAQIPLLLHAKFLNLYKYHE